MYLYKHILIQETTHQITSVNVHHESGFDSLCSISTGSAERCTVVNFAKYNDREVQLRVHNAVITAPLERCAQLDAVTLMYEC
jgi:hypothetical protein